MFFLDDCELGFFCVCFVAQFENQIGDSEIIFEESDFCLALFEKFGGWGNPELDGVILVR